MSAITPTQYHPSNELDAERGGADPNPYEQAPMQSGVPTDVNAGRGEPAKETMLTDPYGYGAATSAAPSQGQANRPPATPGH
jgi:hypothetical protein